MFEKLCALMCTEQEICGFFGITDKTLARWCKETYGLRFSEAFKVYSMDGKISLRRMQFRLAEKSAGMAIFLGKQYLGQSDFPNDDNALEAAMRVGMQYKTIAEQLAAAQPAPQIEEMLAEANESSADSATGGDQL